MQPLSGNQRPNLLTSLMNMSLLMRLPREMHLYKSSSNVPHRPSFLELLQTLTFSSLLARCRIPCTCHAKSHLNLQKLCFWHFLTFWLGNVLRATTACTFSSSQLPKVLREWCARYILTLKCASRHNGVHFFNFQKCSEPVSVLHFWLRKCFAPQRRALFRHLNFQKWSEHAVFCTFWLPNVLRATTACKLFISHLARWLRTRRFSDATFRSSRATNHLEKHYVSRLSYLFAHLDLLSSETFSFLIFFLLLFSSLTLPISAFHLSMVGSLTSKFPSIVSYNII